MLTETVPGSRSVSLGVFVGVGSRHEGAGQHGASHFLEHVLFKGTRRRTAEEISTAVEAVGGDLNAYTTKEYTCFYARVTDDQADLATDVVTDLVTEPLIASADVRSERAVILDEIAMHADDPAEVASELAARATFGEDGLGRPVIGSQHSVGALSRAQVARHWARHYRPRSMVVAAAGNVDHNRLVDRLTPLLESRFAPLPRPPRPTRVGDAGRLVALQRRLGQATAVLALPGPGVFDSRRYPLGLLTLVVGGGMSSRLFVEVRERRGLAYGIDAGETAYTDAGLWTVEWQCAPERLVEIVSLVQATLADVAQHGVSAEELARARGQMRGQTILGHEGPVSRMGWLGSNALVGDERSLTELLQAYDAVTPDDISRVAAELFTRPPVLAVVAPRLPRRRLESILHRW